LKNFLDQIHTTLYEKLGFKTNVFDDAFIEKVLLDRIQFHSVLNLEEYFQLLLKSKDEASILNEKLLNSHSEFFRDTLTFSVLESIVLPAILIRLKSQNRKEIRIWSAACASGQEVYSIAILLEEIKRNTTAPFTYRIFATDQSNIQIKKAIEGKYHISALNKMSLKRVNDWFIIDGEMVSMKQELKKNVEFSVFDLLHPSLSSPPVSIFGDFDIVFCANLLFYYKDEFRKLILSKVSKSLASDGYLITGETEREIVRRNNFIELFPRSAIFKMNSTYFKMRNENFDEGNIQYRA
jgi:chemotaxis methyl-accepting protein methylase